MVRGIETVGEFAMTSVEPRTNRAMVAANAVLAALAAVLALMFAFNWLVPAPDSWPRLHPLYGLGMILFGASSIAFVGAWRAFAAGHPARWLLQALAAALAAAFHTLRYTLLVG